MEQILFERPREKLQAKGVAYLSTIELLQIIIGSGNAKASAARLAKRVGRVIESGSATTASLLAIDGIGTARACQLMAAIELGKRLNTPSPHDDLTQRIIKTMSLYRHKVLSFYSFDGANKLIGEEIYSLGSGLPPPVVVRDVCMNATHVNARSVMIAIGSKKGELELDMSDLSLVAAVYDGLRAFQIVLSAVYSANEIVARRIKRK